MIRSERREFFLHSGVALAGALAGGLGCSVRDSGWRAHIAAVETLVPEAMARHSIPGLSMAVIRDAQVVWSRGFGVQAAESKAPVDSATVFEAASMSKPVFAYAVLKLCEKGLLALDTPLTRYASERFLPGDAQLDLITARHVLSHTSGFQDIRSGNEPLKIGFRPGTKWQYSGEGYAYLQSVMTKVAGHTLASPCSTFEADLRVCGTDFDGYMRKNILAPFGMTSSGYLWTEAMAPHLARPHDEGGTALPVHKADEAGAARYGAMGGLLTTASDYARFLTEVILARPADDFRLNSASMREMLRPQVKVEDGPGYSISWGLGWKLAQTEEFGDLVSHGGDQAGFHCLAEVSRGRRSGYVVLTNGESGWKLIRDLAPKLARRVYGVSGK